jgi:hypothetical protein
VTLEAAPRQPNLGTLQRAYNPQILGCRAGFSGSRAAAPTAGRRRRALGLAGTGLGSMVVEVSAIPRGIPIAWTGTVTGWNLYRLAITQPDQFLTREM